MTFNISISGGRSQTPYTKLTEAEEIAMRVFIAHVKKGLEDLRREGFTASGLAWFPTNRGGSESVTF